MTAYSEFLRPASISSESGSHQIFKEEEVSVLDDEILDGSVEFADMFGGEFADPDMTSTNPSNPFCKSNPFAVGNGLAPDTWTSGSCTPNANFENFDASTVYVAGASTHVPGSANAFDMQAMNPTRHGSMTCPSASSTTTVSFSPSPLGASQEWMSPTSTEATHARPLPSRRRPGSPLRPHSPLLRRGDGIRKKNARFEIPAERNLHNIDHFIARSSDDQEIKELKQQKRLLRNRQAALDSRQRKKLHTERLEEEKKTSTTIITELEERVAELELRESQHMRAEEQWKANQQTYEHYVQTLLLEKEELVRRHTLESADLRKKNAFLTEHTQKLESTAMSAAPSSSAFSNNDFSDIDSITMEGGSWDQYSFLNDFSVETEQKPVTLPHPAAPSQTSLTVPLRKVDQVASSDSDRPAASGILLVLLLCGAFVASRSATTSTPNIPRMPDDVIAASATVLDNIFKDAGVQHQGGDNNPNGPLEPMPSNAAWPSAKATKTKKKARASKATAAAHRMIGLSDTSLDVLSQRLVSPTIEQERDQIFSLSADQYTGVTSQDFLDDLPSTESQSVSQDQRNHHDATLASASGPILQRSHGGTSARSTMAEVYTRSLMWDQVPAEVVREFARFVADNEALARQAKAEQEA